MLLPTLFNSATTGGLQQWSCSAGRDGEENQRRARKKQDRNTNDKSGTAAGPPRLQSKGTVGRGGAATGGENYRKQTLDEERSSEAERL